MAGEMKILVVCNQDRNNSKRITIPQSVADLQALQTLIEKKFRLEQGSIDHLQIHDKDLEEYVNLESLEEVQNKSKINAVMRDSDAPRGPKSNAINRKPQSPSPPPPTRHIKLNDPNEKYFNILFEASYIEAINHWRNIGIALKLHQTDLTSIDNYHRGDPGRCYNAMLAKWFESSTNCYLHVFTDALKAPTVNLAPAIPHIEKKIYEHADKGTVLDLDAPKRDLIVDRTPEDGHTVVPSEKVFLNVDNRPESTDGVEIKKYPICLSATIVESSGPRDGALSNGASAHINCEKIWSGRDALKVYFMNPELLEGKCIPEGGSKTRQVAPWKCRGHVININNIISWARVWNTAFFNDTIPFLQVTEVMSKADIRVKFTSKGGNQSMVGTDAKNVKQNQPTMYLNLRQYSPELQESIVVHEFGHALGLEHEHQRSDFWNVVEKYIDLDTMMNDPFVNGDNRGGDAFGKDWYKDVEALKGKKNSIPYDPDSIMHYLFKLDWIKKEAYHTEASIDTDSTLSEQAKRYLKGIVKRSKGPDLVRHPSLSDYKALVEAYGKSKGIKFIPPTNFSTDSQQATIVPELEVDESRLSGDQLKKIREVTWEARAQWNRIGVELGLSSRDIETIEDEKHNVEDRYTAVLEKWVELSPNPQISDLDKVLESSIVGRTDLARKLAALK